MAGKKAAKGCAKACKKDANLIIRFFVKGIRSGITPGLVPYFFWSSLLYIATGLFTIHSYFQIKEFLCKIPGEANATTGHGVGCSDCDDNILMCGKGVRSNGKPFPDGICWKYAVNLTIQEYDTTLSSKISEFEKASMDRTCNTLVGGSKDPVAMLENILRAICGNSKPGCLASRNSDDYPVSAGCIAFNCRVLQNALSNRELSYLRECSNDLGMKPSSEANSCPCNALRVSESQQRLFSEFDSMCLSAGVRTSLLDTEFQRLLLAKPACYRQAVSAQHTAPAYLEFETNADCTRFIENGTTVFSWFKAAQSYGLEHAAYSMEDVCKTVMCSAVQTSLTHKDCDWNSDANLRGVTDKEIDHVNKYCQGYQPKICRNVSDPTSLNICANSSSVTQRRLQPTSMFERQIITTMPSSVTTEPVRNVALEHELVGVRHLTDTSNGNNNGNAVQDYEVEDWGKCTCMQTCVAGIQTRSVTCPSDPTGKAGKCFQPKPAEVQPCECTHCAACNMFYTTVLFAFLYIMQGSAAFLLWLAFWTISSRYDEDDWSDVGFCSKILGFFCKFLPGIVRFFTFSTFVFLGVILTQAFIPWFGQSDCKESTRFQVMAVLVTVTWSLQMILGVYMARRNPMPPWLHYQSSSRTARFLCRPCRKLGP